MVRLQSRLIMKKYKTIKNLKLGYNINNMFVLDGVYKIEDGIYFATHNHLVVKNSKLHCENSYSRRVDVNRFAEYCISGFLLKLTHY